MKKEFAVVGMGCQHCVHSIEQALSTLTGVNKVKVSLENNNAVIEYDENLVTEADFQQAVDDAGYELVI